MTEIEESSGASRRDVLRSGALGVGALAAVVGASGLSAAPATAAPMASAALPSGTDSYFLKLDGVVGDSTDARHQGEIQLLSFSWGVANSGGLGSATGGAGAGKASLSDLSFTAKSSKASPMLFLNAVTGRHLRTGVITVVHRNRSGQPYLKIELTQVLVSSYDQGASNGAAPVDAVSLKFAKIRYSFYPLAPDGSVGTPVTGSWDVTTNRAG